MLPCDTSLPGLPPCGLCSSAQLCIMHGTHTLQHLSSFCTISCPCPAQYCTPACVHTYCCWMSNSLYGLRAMHLVNLCRLKRCGNALNLYAGRLITVRGIVTRASAIRRLILGMEFACTRCGCCQRCSFPDGAAARPGACSEGCRSRSFTPVLDSADTVAWQRIRLQVGHSSPLRAEYVHATGIAQGHMASCSDLQKRSIIYVPVPGIGAGDAGFEATWECSGS